MQPTADDVRAAAAAIADDIVRTPQARSATLSALTGADVHVKFENLQFTGSFKDRGSANHLRGLGPEARTGGVVALSAGNHAQGVAYHAARLGIPATIVMPASAPFIKVANTRALGAEVVQAGSTLAEAAAELGRLRDQGLHVVPPFDDAAVIAGQGTVALEMLADAPDLDVLVVPVGGGGLLAGMALAARAIRPDIELIGVQIDGYTDAWRRFHTGADGAAESEATGSPQIGAEGAAASPPSSPATSSPSSSAAEPGPESVSTSPSRPVQTVADGIAVKHPGRLTMAVIRDLVDDVVTVSEETTERAITLYAEIEKTVAEGSGAVPLAAVLDDPDRFARRRVGLVLSGGNIDTRLLASVLVRGLVRDDRVSTLRMQVPDMPGELARVLEVIGRTGANVIDVEHRRDPAAATARGAAIEVMVETLDFAHRDRVVAALTADGLGVQVVG